MTPAKTRRDLLIAFASQFGFKILGFAVLALMARRLSQAEYGKLMFALTLCGVTVLVTDLGASTDLSRRVAACPGGARRYGALGAAWVTVASQTCVGVWLIADAYRSVARHPRMAMEPERQLETAIALRDD